MLRSAGLMLLFAAYPALADIAQVVGPATNPSAGDTFSVDVSVAGVSDLYAFQFDLNYDPTLLKAVSVTEGPFLPGGGTTFFIPGTIDNVGGSVMATADSLIGPVPGVTGDGVLATFQFVAVAPGTSALSFANPIFLDSSLNDITADTSFLNGSVTVEGPVPEPEVFIPVCAILVLLAIYGPKRARSRKQLENQFR